MTVILKTPPTEAANAPGAYLDDKAFDALIWQHGREVIHETALRCPCKSDESNQLSTCKNCGGTGWTFINPKQTRFVVTKVNAITEFKDWSDKIRGMINFSCIEDEQVSYMDRITLLAGNAIHNEVIHFKKQDGVTFAYCAYNIKKVLYCARFVNDTTAYQRLTLGVHYSIENNIVRIIDSGIAAIEDLSITIRYYYAPQYHVMEMVRETIQSWRRHPGKELQSLPVSGVAQRAHYIVGMKNITSDNIIDNSFESPCEVRANVVVDGCGGSGTGQFVLIINTVNQISLPTITYTFTNQSELNIIHNFGRTPDVSIKNDQGKLVRGQVTFPSNTTVNIKFNRAISGEVILQ